MFGRLVFVSFTLMNFQMRLPTIGLASHSAYRPEVKSAAKKTVPTEERAIELDSRFFSEKMTFREIPPKNIKLGLEMEKNP